MQIRGSTQIKDASIPQIKILGTIDTNKLTDGATFLRSSGGPNLLADFDFGGFKGVNAASPVNANDLVNKAYVDALVHGFDFKGSVKVATTVNISLSGLQTVDGISLAANDRVLVKNQTDPAENGIYDVASGAWSRSSDANTNAKVTSGLFVIVSEGTNNSDTLWLLTTNDTITLGTTGLTFTNLPTAGSIVAGQGLTKTGNQLDVNLGNGLQFSSNNIVAKLGLGLAFDGTGSIKISDPGIAKILIGDSGGLASYVNISGDATLSSAGVLTLASTVAKLTNYIARETPSGTVNGTNAAFTLANTPVSNTEHVYVNGILQELTLDYTISTNTITFVAAPLTGDIIKVSYWR